MFNDTPHQVCFRPSQRGIALLTAVMFALVMSVVARGIMKLTLGAQSQQSVYEKRARQAAISGMEYARSQLAKESDWRGADPLRKTIDSPTFVVEEVDGNVVGRITYPDGGRAQFRIRFNGQDGPAGFDDRDDPEAAFVIDNSLLSVNNLNKSGQVDLPQIDGNYAAMTGSSQGKVPAHAVLVQVEGRAGLGIDGMTGINSAPSGYVRVVRLEAMLRATLAQQSGPAVLQSAGNIAIRVEEEVDVSSADDTDPSIRSKQSIAVNGPMGSLGDLTMEDGHVYSLDSALSANYDPSEVTVHDEAPSSSFLELTWDQVNKPGEEAVELAGGVYVLWPPETTGGGSGFTGPPDPGAKLHYYDMSYDQYLQEIHLPYVMMGILPPNEGLVVSQDMSETRPAGDAGQHPNGILINDSEITINEDIAVVESTGGHTDFAVIPLSDAPMGSSQPKAPATATTTSGTSASIYGADPLTVNISGSRIYSQGRMVFKGADIQVSQATLIGESGLTLNTGDLSVVGDEQNLSLYFKGDIEMSSYGMNEQYGDFDITGTVYSWGNVYAYLSEPGPTMAGSGLFGFRGTMVAYGGDPANGTPGAQSPGEISVLARRSELIYDPTTVTQLVDPEDLGQDLVLTSTSIWIR
jgi:hypothetical protein